MFDLYACTIMEKNIQTMADHLLKLVIFLVVLMNTHQVHGDQPDKEINITLVTDATAKGAVCNDGSSAAYYYSPGFGEGVNNWLVHLTGGAWCSDDNSCFNRLHMSVGSSTHNAKTVTFRSMKSSNQTLNPDLYNWNKVHIVYCDSSSFMGLTDHPKIASRGARIFEAIMDELLQKGMACATNAMLSGSSAGGLAAILHCDGFRAFLPESSRVKCVSDSGFFIHAPKLHGAEITANAFANVAAYHGFTNKLPSSCTSRMNASLCIFPEYIVKDIKTPLFLVETKFDQLQMPSRYVKDGGRFTKSCIANLTLCTPSDLLSMKDYGMAVTGLLQEIRNSSSIGMFVHPCLRHGHFFEKFGWRSSYKLKNKTIAQAVGDWFYDRDVSFQEIDMDHEYPLTCRQYSSKYIMPNVFI
ncbi:hypothetical protein CASFOL_021077 [Castilleja foliolosa]|uniref:Pectin acetylesterase n=1 Tax=Castilleja foliolosa TaxID=1961234 RepID=A0ABD3CWF0_9LAMI